jgi:hypothetical protein
MTSILKYQAQKVKINDHPWLDSLHQDSEVKNYFTRYMGTLKDEIAILVTFSAHNKYYSKYSSNFDKTIRSLRVVATKDIHNSLASDRQTFGVEKYGNLYANTEIAANSSEIERSPASFSAKRKKDIAVKGLLLLTFIILITRLMSRKES